MLELVQYETKTKTFTHETTGAQKNEHLNRVLEYLKQFEMYNNRGISRMVTWMSMYKLEIGL